MHGLVQIPRTAASVQAPARAVFTHCSRRHPAVSASVSSGAANGSLDSVPPEGGSFTLSSSNSSNSSSTGASCLRRVLTRVVASPTLTTTTGITATGCCIDVEDILLSLKQYYLADLKEPLHSEAVEAAEALKNIVSDAVNSKYAGLRSLQSTIVSSDALSALRVLASRREPIAYEALQILCYRNTVACQQVVADGIVDRIAIDMPSASTRLQCSMCYLLTAIAAFSEASHPALAAAGLIPLLVAACRPKKALEGDNPKLLARLENVSAAVLRNLAHNPREHTNLIKAGAVDALADITRKAKDPAGRINAALAVACLVGHEESNPRLQLEDELVVELLDVLEAASQGTMAYGIFWTLWKLCQGMANLSGNEKNKVLITAGGGVELMADVLQGRHHNNEATHRYALSTIWNLAFNDDSRRVILNTPGLVDVIRHILATTESPKTREVAKGALWTLGVELEVKAQQEQQAHVVPVDIVADELDLQGAGGHIMLSYEWGQQSSVLLMKSELQRAGYQTWMDVDEMSGSTLEAMARAVENSAVVLICVSSKYKESQACRTEAEYAFQQRKKIVPIVMERGYRPSGWLGALMGTRLYIDMSDAQRIPNKSQQLFKELGGDGKIPTAAGSSNGSGSSSGSGSRSSAPSMEMQGSMDARYVAGDTPEAWGLDEVEEWLKKLRFSGYASHFREKDMDGLALSGLLRMTTDMRLMHEVLVAEFNIVSLGHRLRLIEELHRLFA